MPVSYLSQNVLKADPYVIPMNLDLMAKVLSVKQEKFDTNARKTQQGIANLANTDLLKQQDKAYLNDKVNSLVNNVNQIGGADFSDDNVANQIDMMGTDIYNDDKVINAMSSTKQIRALQEGYKSYKTDPKLNKLYSVANEWNDLQPVEQYLRNEEVGAIYGGSSAPTPYSEYKQKLFNNLKSVKANYEETMRDNGLFYSKTTSERVTPERIAQAAADLLTADEKAQLERDGLYSYKDLTKGQLIQKAHDVNQFKLSGAYATLQGYTDGYIQAANDPLAKKTYEGLIDEQKKEIDALKATMDVATYSTAFDSSPKGFQVQVYKDEFYRGLSSTFAYNKIKQDVVENKAAMFNLRMAQAERFHNDQMDLGYFNAGVKRGKDGKLEKAGDAGSEFTYTENNIDPNDPYKVSSETFAARNTELTNENTVAVKSFFNDFALANPDLFTKVPSALSPTGNDYRIKGESVIEDNNGIAGIQFDDFKNLTPGTKEYNEAVNVAKLTPEQVNTFATLYDNYNRAATGQAPTDVKMPDGFATLVKKIQFNNEAISANNEKVAGINNTLLRKYGVSAEEVKLLEDVKKLDHANEAVTTAIATAINASTNIPIFMLESVLDKFRSSPAAAYLKSNPGLFEKYVAAFKKTNNYAYENDKNALYSAVENKPFFPQMTLQGGFLSKEKEQATKNLASTLLNQIGEVTSGETKFQGIAIPAESIELKGVGRQNNGTYAMTVGVKTGSGDKASYDIVKVALQPQQVRQLGFFDNPYQVLDESVGLSGRSKPLFITADLNRSIPGRKLPLKASVVVRRLTNTREDLSAIAELVDQNGKKITEIRDTRASSPSAAFALAEAVIQTYEKDGFDYDKMVTDMINRSY